jgi:hypothetical protein
MFYGMFQKTGIQERRFIQILESFCLNVQCIKKVGARYDTLALLLRCRMNSAFSQRLLVLALFGQTHVALRHAERAAVQSRLSTPIAQPAKEDVNSILLIGTKSSRLRVNNFYERLYVVQHGAVSMVVRIAV